MANPAGRAAGRAVRTRSRVTALSTAVVILALVVLALRQEEPPRALAATAPPTVFSADRALAHVRAIAERPHPSGSADHDRVEQYVLTQLTAMGLHPTVQTTTGVSTVYAVAGVVHNVVARLPGSSGGTRAVMLSAHYDGVPAGPAASDDAAGIATLLETVRALRAGPPLRNDVIILCTDGEEDGLLGAAAFVAEHPWMRDVEVALNFEARGTGGRSGMFEASSGDAALIRAFARSAPHPFASSLMYALYKIMPNDTDGSELKRGGAQLLNFAFAKHVEQYHTPGDNVAHLDPRSLQDQGESALSLARSLGDAPLPLTRDHDAVYFSVFDHLFAYPESLAQPFALIAAGVFVALVILGMRRRELTMRGIAVGLFALIVAGAAAWGASVILWRAISAAHARWGGSPNWRPVYLLAVVVLTGAVTLAVYAFARRWARASELLAGACVPWVIAGVVVAIELTGGSYLFFLPVISGLVVLAAMIWWRDGTVRRLRTQVVVAAGAAVPLLLLVPIIVDTHMLLGATAALLPGYTILTVLTLGVMAGAIAVIVDGAPVVAPLVALAATVLIASWGVRTVRDDADHPIVQNIVYALAPDASAAALVLEGNERGAWARTVMSDSGPLPSVFAAAFRRQPARHRTVSVSESALSIAPTFAIVSDTRGATARDIVIDVRVGDAREVRFELPSVQPSAAYVNGHLVRTAGYRRPRERGWELSFANPEGLVRLHLVLPDTARAMLTATTERSGLPLDIGLSLPPRPAFVSPIQHGDRTVVIRTLQL